MQIPLSGPYHNNQGAPVLPKIRKQIDIDQACFAAAAGYKARRAGTDAASLGDPGRESSPVRMPTKQQVFAFIRSRFRSVWALELLCFLRQNRDRALSRAEMVAGLRGSDLVVVQGVESLAASGLVAAGADGSARYDPASEALDQLVQGTEALYAERPDAVRRAIARAFNLGAAPVTKSGRAPLTRSVQ